MWREQHIAGASKKDDEEPVWDPGWDPLIGFLDRIPTDDNRLNRKAKSSFGPINMPKRKKDLIMWQALCEECNKGNIREARSLIFHNPELLPLTDQFGFTVLHYAQLSKNGEFYAHLLQLLHDPRSFVKKMVWYDTVDSLREDGLLLSRTPDYDSQFGERVTVQKVTKGSRAAFFEVAPGDRIEGVCSHALATKKAKKIYEEVVSIACGIEPEKAKSSFPLAIEFRGPALREILDEGDKALRNAVKQMEKEQKRQAKKEKIAAAFANLPQPSEGAIKVFPKPPKQAADLWPAKKKKHDPSPHCSVLPTLLVREGGQQDGTPAPKVIIHPLAPIYEARAAAGRAAERVAAARMPKAKSTSTLVPQRGHSDEGEPSMKASVSLPALVQAEEPEAQSSEQTGRKGADNMAWSRPHWLPKGSKVVKPAPRKDKRSKPGPTVSQLRQQHNHPVPAVPEDAKSPDDVGVTLKMDAVENSFIF